MEDGVFTGLDVKGVGRIALGCRCGKHLDCLPGAACGLEGCYSSQHRFKAIRLLQRHFPIASRKLAVQHGVLDKDVESFWRRRQGQARQEGLRMQKAVCCRTVEICVPLDAQGEPDRFVPPILPCWKEGQQTSGGRLAVFVEEERRRLHRAELSQLGMPCRQSHGQEFLALPSDFLCPQCAYQLRKLQPDACTDAGSWCRRMGLRVDTGVASASEVLHEEQERLLLRDELLVTSRDADATRFRAILMDSRLSSQSVISRLSGRWQHVLASSSFHVHASKGGIQ